MEYPVHPRNSSPQIDRAFSILKEALNTQEQKEALQYLNRELGMASAYIAELEWDVEEAAALIVNYLNHPEWSFSADYLESWTKDCYERLKAHREIQLSCMIEKPAERMERTLD